MAPKIWAYFDPWKKKALNWKSLQALNQAQNFSIQSVFSLPQYKKLDSFPSHNSLF